jgi:hypothetical protein
MTRHALPEFSEARGVPKFLRESLQDIFGRGVRWGKFYDDVGPLLADFCIRSKSDAVLDLASGTGEAVAVLIDVLAKQQSTAPRFILSDASPDVSALARVVSRYPQKLEALREPIDPSAVRPEVDPPARSVLTAFHHFSPEEAKGLFADCVARRRAIFILEGFPRSVLRMSAIMPVMLLATLAHPFVTERARLLKAFFTFVVPIIPILGLWDAIVSALRIYDERELRAMTERYNDDYCWEYHEVPYFPLGRATVFLGIPGERLLNTGSASATVRRLQ